MHYLGKFLLFLLWDWSWRKHGATNGQWPTTTSITIAAPTRNCPLATHRRQLTLRRCIRSIGDNPLSKGIYFSLAIRGLMTLKMLRWWGKIHCHHCLIIGAFWGPYTLSLLEESSFACLVIVPYQSDVQALKLYLVCRGRGPFLVVAAMVVMVVVVGRWWLISSGRLMKLGSDHTNSMVSTMVWTANYLDG